MCSSKTRYNLTYSLAAMLLLFHAFADAGLVRGGGRGTHSDSSNTLYVLVNDSYVNDFGLSTEYVPLEQREFNSGLDQLVSTPADCEAIFADIFDLQENIEFAGFKDDPCYYQNYQNDARLEFTGFGRALFELAFDTRVTWTLSRDGFPPVIIEDDGSAIVGNEVILDTLMPSELVPGEYLIDLSVEFLSGPQHSFFRAQGESFDDVNCQEVSENELQCYLSEYSQSDSIAFNSQYRERLVVLPAAVDVNEPAGLALFLLVLLAIFGKKLKRL